MVLGEVYGLQEDFAEKPVHLAERWTAPSSSSHERNDVTSYWRNSVGPGEGRLRDLRGGLEN
jgi:hypothetical protein